MQRYQVLTNSLEPVRRGAGWGVGAAGRGGGVCLVGDPVCGCALDVVVYTGREGLDLGFCDLLLSVSGKRLSVAGI